MRPLNLPAFLVMLSVASGALAQNLECPAPTGTGHPCDAFHYHVLMYRPDTRGFAEFYGTNAFASMSACERARSAAIQANLAVVDYFKRVRNEQQYEADRFGACHCDMTAERTSTNFLTDAARAAQIRAAGDVRMRVREHLLDADLTTDSPLVRSLATPPATPFLGGPKVVPLPARAAAAETENATSDLRSTRVGEIAKPAVSDVDLPLVDVASGAFVTPPRVAQLPPAPPPRTVEVIADPPDAAAVDDAAGNFVAYETRRIQNVLKASAAIADETVKAKIFEACMQRIQLLSNLRRLIEGSGVRSRLAAASRTAKSESERTAFIARLFGNDITPHWAPKDAADVILAPVAGVDANPERVLRDTSGRFSIAQKKRALYLMLARSQPTEEQQLWLATLADSFLQ